MTVAAETPSGDLVAGLCRALRQADGLPLLAGRSQLRLFPATAAGRRLAEEARAGGFLNSSGMLAKGKTSLELFTLSEAGQRLLEAAADPKPLLEQLLAAVQARQAELTRLESQMADCGRQLAAVAARVLAVLPQVTATRGAFVSESGGHARAATAARRASEGAAECLATALLARLSHWEHERPSADCPLAELFGHLSSLHPTLTVGAFHDELRRLHGEGALTLEQWTGPLAELPEPHLALLAGHAVMAYARQT